MPADRRAGTILVDECHRKRIGIDASPLRNRRAQRQQKCWPRLAGPRLYDWPKNATRRRATTPRISKSETRTWPMASNTTRSSASVMKFSR